MNPSLEPRAGLLRRRNANLLGFLWCAFLVAYALYAQYVQMQEPCPLCILQRVAVIVVGAIFLVAFVFNPADRAARIYSVLINLTVLVGIGIAGRHLWILAQPPGAVAECGASLDYMMDVLPLHEVLGKVLTGSGECVKVTWEFLGISMPGWVLIHLIGLALLGTVANFVLRRR